MKIQEILKASNHNFNYDNRNRATKQLNNLLSETSIEVRIAKKGFIFETKRGTKWNVKISGYGFKGLYRLPNNVDFTPLDILTKVGRFLQSETLQKIIKADVTLPCSCSRCNGAGVLSQFYYYAEGVCFDCMGSGMVSNKTSVELNKKMNTEN